MKKVLSLIMVLLSFLFLASCGSEKSKPKYSGTDVNGKTAQETVSLYYKYFEDRDFENMAELTEKPVFEEAVELVSLKECFAAEEYKPDDEVENWHKGAYAYCAVQTQADFYLREDCAYGSKGETVHNSYTYYLIMETENSEWKIAEYGYPPVA